MVHSQELFCLKMSTVPCAIYSETSVPTHIHRIKRIRDVDKQPRPFLSNTGHVHDFKKTPNLKCSSFSEEDLEPWVCPHTHEWTSSLRFWIRVNSAHSKDQIGMAIMWLFCGKLSNIIIKAKKLYSFWEPVHSKVLFTLIVLILKI